MKLINLNLQTIFNPMLNCEVCGFSFCEKYGDDLGKGFIEVHHKTPLHESKRTETTANDIALICSNCHKMIHKKLVDEENSIMTIDELKKIITNRDVKSFIRSV